jgi:hypothetical protein
VWVLCTRPPKCILFRPHSATDTTFPDMDSNTIPVFPSQTSVKIGKMSVPRLQVPVTPAWALTDYKVQGSTCDAVTLDLHRGGSRNNGSSTHNKHCSSYVQLSRVRTSKDLFLLQPIILEDVNNKPDEELLREERRLADLARLTDVAWTKTERSNKFRHGRRHATAP